MPVFYPFTLRKYYCLLGTGTANFKPIFFLFLSFIYTSSIGLYGQETKEVNTNKAVQLTKQEADAIETKIKANPGSTLQKRNPEIFLNRVNQSLNDEVPKSVLVQLEQQDKAKIEAQKALERSMPPQQGVEYRIISSGNTVEYVITNNSVEIFRQKINSIGSNYEKNVQAEKEAIFASNKIRSNPNYPTDILRAEINSLVNAQRVSVPINRTVSINRTTADYTFNGGGGTIPGSGTGTSTGAPADPYPSTVAVSGVPLGATVKEVIIGGISHTFPDDIDIVLQSPTGANVILMSDCGFADDLVSVNYTFNDGAATGLQDNDISPSGSYKPTNFGTGDNWPAPGPLTAPSSVTLSTFGSGDMNGTWKLFIVDDAGLDQGSWTSWSITFTDPIPVCFPINITGQPSNTSICTGANGSFVITASPNGVSYNWQVNTGSGFTYLTNTGVYSGVNTETLNITGATLAMNGYQYRCVVTCSQGGLPEISNAATLTTNASPSSPIVTPTSGTICPGDGPIALTATMAASPTTASSGTISVAIPDNNTAGATSTINVSGFPALPVATISVNFNITHTWDGDLEINLVAPNGNILNLVNNRGGSSDNFINTVISSNATTAISSGSAPFTGTYLPDATTLQGPTGYISNVTLFSDLFSVPNGNWTLAIRDGGGGDVGTLTSWSITITPSAVANAVWSPATGLFNDMAMTSAYVAGTYQSTVYAAPISTTTYSASFSNGTCNSLPTNVTVSVNQNTLITTQPVNTSTCVGASKTISLEATGSNLTYQWQVDPNTGTFSNITASANNPSGFIYSGYTSNTLTISTVMASMNNFKYRCIVTGGCPPAQTSNVATLTINQLPVISVTNNSQCAPGILSASGADTYAWSPSAGLSATTGATVTANPTANTTYIVTGTDLNGCANTSQIVVKNSPGEPNVTPTAATICLGNVQSLSVTAPPPGVTVSSGAINVPIPDADPVTGANHSLTVAGFTGAVQSITVTFNITHTWDSDLDINLVAPNGNILNLVGARGGSGDNFTNTTISSTSTTSLGTGSAPFTGTFAADGLIGWGPSSLASNVSTFASLFSVPNGTWKIAMADFATGDVGTLTSWSITISGPPPPTSGVWTPITGLFSDVTGTVPYIAGTATSTVYASPASTTTYSVSLVNDVPLTTTFSSGGPVTIAGVAPTSSSSGAGAPYPSVISVSGLPANAVLKSATLKGIRHSFSSDIDIVLQSPTGTNVVLMSDVGSSGTLSGVTYNIDDAGGAMSTSGANGSGTYHPTNNGATDTYPAPLGSISQATPSISMFTGDPNGAWNLYVADDAGGDVGMITSWELTFAIVPTTNCTSPPHMVTVTVNSPITITTQPQNRTACQNSNVTFTAAASGTIQTTQWQVSVNGGAFTNITGATSATLTLNSVQPSMTGNKYRCVFGSTACGTTNSIEATLTVNALPVVSLSTTPANQLELSPGKMTTLNVTSTPAATSYTWFVDGTSQPAISGSSYIVDAYHLGTYTVEVTDANGCKNTSAGVTFTAKATNNIFIYPNPTSGAFYVTYYLAQTRVPLTISVFDMKGSRIIERHETTSAPYTRFDFNSDKLAPGVYIIEIRNSGGDRLDYGRLVITR